MCPCWCPGFIRFVTPFQTLYQSVFDKVNVFSVGCRWRMVSEVGDQDLIQSISTVLLSCWRFQKFTESRWLTVGASTRVLVRAVLLGLDDLYRHLTKDVD